MGAAGRPRGMVEAAQAPPYVPDRGDVVWLHFDPQIGRVKDMGSAAVGLALLIAAVAWLLALAERLGLI